MLVNGKKGTADETIIKIFEILIAAAVILLLIYVGQNILKIFSNDADQGTKVSFDVLHERIKALAPDQTVDNVFYIKPGFVLYGFNQDSDKVVYKRAIGVLNVFGNPSTSKPKACNGRACICICDDDGCDKNIKDCRMVDGINYYVVSKMQKNQGDDYASGSGQVKGQYLALFGRAWGFGPIGDDYKTHTIRIQRKGDVVYFSDT